MDLEVRGGPQHLSFYFLLFACPFPGHYPTQPRIMHGANEMGCDGASLHVVCVYLQGVTG